MRACRTESIPSARRIRTRRSVSPCIERRISGEQSTFLCVNLIVYENEKKRRLGVVTSVMALALEVKRQIIAKNQVHKTDVGSPEVQIAILSGRLAQLKAHFEA